jgi:GNAT superfamily N-acetyltransferase
MITQLARRFRHSGFVGPRYKGVFGRARFFAESVFGRREILFVATPSTFVPARMAGDSELHLHPITKFEDLAPFREEFDRAFYPGYIDRWRAPFTWGEQAVVGTIDGRVVSYNWIQRGTIAGFPTYYGRLFQDEARVLRGGVLPAYRGRGINRVMKSYLLAELFDDGANRVYGECYAGNVPSIRSLLGIGFKPFALITVLEIRPMRQFIRWHSSDILESTLQRLDVPRSVSGISAP